MIHQKNRKAGGSQRRQHQREILRDFNVNPGITSSLLLVTIQQHVSSTLDNLGQECVRETYSHRIIFMALMIGWEVTDKPHKNDDLRFQQAREVRDYTARFRPGSWTFVDPGEDSEVPPVGRRQSERQLGQKGLTCFQNTKKQTIVIPGTIFLARNPPTEEGKRKHPLQRAPRDRQRDVQADRVGEPPVFSLRYHEVRG